jgi:hypothetical protein
MTHDIQTPDPLKALKAWREQEDREWRLLKRWAAWVTIAVLVGLAVEVFFVFIIGGAR